MKPDQAPFNTAVFYDIENLLGGYNFNVQWVAELSLKDILTRIRATGLTGRIAVQRAYANWSDPRLGILRNEINELGIDPIQIFGFSRDAKRNAADIQLAIDAIDLAHLRPAIGTFVIVSGDGG
ncbi:MAG: NYN domain-containing protein [Verrucomicrobiota bacterium]